MHSHQSSQTLEEGSSERSSKPPSKLKLDNIAPSFILPVHMTDDEFHDIEDALINAEAPITYDINEARLFLSKVTQKRRAVLELRTRGVHTEECTFIEKHSSCDAQEQVAKSPRPRIGEKRSWQSSQTQEPKAAIDLTIDSTTESESELPSKPKSGLIARSSQKTHVVEKCAANMDSIRVVRTSWLFESLDTAKLLPFGPFLVYEGRRISSLSPTIPESRPRSTAGPALANTPGASNMQGMFSSTSILHRAQNEAKPPPPSQDSRKRFHGAVEQRDREGAYGSTTQRSDGAAPLLSQTTTEHDLDLDNDIPEPPEWVKKGWKYACQRSTPVNHPNRKFVDMLKEIRVTRDLIGDQIGIRAYSTAIATLSAYPYTLTSPREISALPGCSSRIAALFAEWKNNGDCDVEPVREANGNARLRTLKLFFDIWGVGASTARDFYNRGWRDLDDIIEQGWNDISRVQQIGVKFYDEFQQKIPRSEVEQIREVVHQHAQRVCVEPEGVRTTIVGGYRRGKAESGDADLMISHLHDARAIDIVDDIAESLHEEGWITHSLGTTHSGSRRGQETLALKGARAGSGFDTLDKTMVVWQDPNFDAEDAVDGRNPNVHRRVDIIISPWSTIGCAVLGWSAGTTFERDLRRYAKYIKNWKFDSSGIRDRATGDVVNVEAVGGRAETVDEAERKVFEGLGLQYRAPWERCTG